MAERALEERLPPARRLPHLDQDRRLHLLPDPGHAEEDAGGDLPQILLHGADALGEAHRHPQPDGKEHREDLLGDVTERQVGEDRVVPGDGGRIHHCARLRQDVAVRDHRALRRPGGPRRIDEEGDLVRVRGGHQLVEERRVRASMSGADPLHLLEGDDAGIAVTPEAAHVGDDDVLHARQVGGHFQDLVDLLLVLADDEGGLRVLHHVPDLGGGTGRVDADADRRRRHRAQLGVDPLAAVLGEDRDLVALGEAERREPEAEIAHVTEVLLPGYALPDSVILLAQRDRLRRLARPLAQELGQRVKGHDSHRFRRL